MGSRARMSAQSVSFSDVLDALVAPVQSETNYKKGKGSNQGFLIKKLLNAILNGKMVKLILRGPRGRCSQV